MSDDKGAQGSELCAASGYSTSLAKADFRALAGGFLPAFMTAVLRQGEHCTGA